VKGPLSIYKTIEKLVPKNSNLSFSEIHVYKFVNLKNPQTYNEKLNWLRLHDHNPAYQEIVDKYETKGYVEKFLGEDCIPTLGVWDSFEDIDFDSLPESFC